MKELRVIQLSGTTTAATTESKPVNWAMSKQHGVRLHKVKFILDTTLDTTAMQLSWALMRGSKTPPTDLQDYNRTDIVAGGRVAYWRDGTGTCQGIMSDTFDVPEQTMLHFTRPAQFLVGKQASVGWRAFVYYTQVKLTKEESLILMKLYHA